MPERSSSGLVVKKGSMAFERIFLSVFLDSSLAMMGKTQQGGRFYDSHHDDLHGVRGGGAEPGHTAAAGRYRRTGTLTQVDVDKFSICLYNIFIQKKRYQLVKFPLMLILYIR